jgi:class 3 adenylate cyclase
MFCDLVGSTALSARLDPDDLRSVIGAYHKRVAETVTGFDGFVPKYRGDGCSSFGYPGTHEDDAERAVRAGLVLMRGARFKGSAASVDQALSFGNTMASKGSAGRRLTSDPKVIA